MESHNRHSTQEHSEGTKNLSTRVLSGMRPTGALHIGHYLGAIENWTSLQQQHECFFMVADLHALMGEYENPQKIREYSRNMVIDWLACGLDPDKSTIFVQSAVPEHAELSLILGMLTPLGWLERNPTYKEQLREIEGRDLTTFGFLGYPVLQAADILLYRASKVPVGEDQLAHLELTREIVRRFKHLYGSDFFPEPEPLLAKQSKLLGTDKRKMSKSYGNTIGLGCSVDDLRKSVVSMVTDPLRVKKDDPGHPDDCNVYSYYKIFSETSQQTQVRDWCQKATKGCVDCKKVLAGCIEEKFEPIRQRKESLTKQPDVVDRIIQKGNEKARLTASQTLAEVKSILGLYLSGSMT